MPEGDTAWRAARNLARALADRSVDRFELRVPAHATADLRGERITGCDSRGKHLLLRVGPWTVHSHFGMDGSWRLVPPEPDRPRRAGVDRARGGMRGPVQGPAGGAVRSEVRGAARGTVEDAARGTVDGAARGPMDSAARGPVDSAARGPVDSATRGPVDGVARGPMRGGAARRGPVTAWPAEHRLRAIIGTDAVIALGIDLPLLELWPTAHEDQRLGWLGPDLLEERPDLDEAARRILAEPDRSITAALLDQRNVAGLGNEYVTEMCFLRGALPTRTVADAGDVREWLDLGRRLMLANRDRVGRTFTGDLRDPAWVFGRADLPCKRCGTLIVEGAHDSGSRRRGATERRSAWCPNCQR